jgi:ATP adenylyltransferase
MKPDFPQKREILWTPWRHDYIKGVTKEKSFNHENACVFCEALKTGPRFESLILTISEHSAIILNKYPYNNGHTMVIPKKHTDDLGALNAEEFADLNAQLLRAYGALQGAYKPQGMNIGMNLGRVGGAGIADHIHFHLLPRWGGDSNFMPLLAHTKVISETLEQTYKRLLPFLK